MLGLAYKADIDDYRESPALEVIDLLRKFGADVKIYDPLIKEYKYKGIKHSDVLKFLCEDEVNKADIVVITTNHSNVDYDMICKNAKRVFDTKNALKKYNYDDKIERM